MKGKIKFWVIGLIGSVMIATGLVGAFAFSGKKISSSERTYASTSYIGKNDEKEVSIKHDDGIVFSAEKVAVVQSDNDADGKTPLNNLYTYITEFTGKNTAYNTGATANYFKDIANGTKSSYVIEDGGFVMLNNVKGAGGYYSTGLSNVQVGGVSTPVQEVVMLTLGYYYNTKNPTTNQITGYERTDDSKGAGITNISEFDVKFTAVGQNNSVTLAAAQRHTYSTNNQEVVYFIPQVAGYEGRYDISYTYFYNGHEVEGDFTYYVIYNSTYNTVINSSDKLGASYNTRPRITVDGAAINNNTYYLGEKEQYPRLTYDYTRYSLNYTHTLNGVVTNYTLTPAYTSNALNNVTANMIVTKEVGGVTTTSSFTLGRYHASAQNNILVLMFTEPGDYVFNYGYLYNKSNAYNSVLNADLPLVSDSLHIVGFDLKYSKVGYLDASMRYLEIAKANDPVDLFIPNGYEKNSTPQENTSIGVAYSLNGDTGLLVGEVIQNEQASVKTAKSGYDLNYASYTSEQLAAVKYAKTNQGSIWFNSGNKFVEGESASYYYYSQTRFVSLGSTGDPEKTAYTNKTTFNQMGYYLIFIKVDPVGDTSGLSNTDDDYYQVFAFQYTTDTVPIDIKTIDGDNTIGALGYTNTNDLKISWEEPGVFERSLSAKIYRAQEKINRTNPEETIGKLLATNGVLFTKNSEGYATINTPTSANSWETFLIELSSQNNDMTTYRMFTVDKTPISNVGLHAKEWLTQGVNGGIYTNGSIKNTTVSAIMSTNEVRKATLWWDDKSSGANIKAKYSYAPFIKDTSITPSISLSNNYSYLTTDYKLGSLVGEFDYTRGSDEIDGYFAESSMFSESGIYMVSLTDDAGNACKYMFIIDNTENYICLSETDDQAINLNNTYISSGESHLRDNTVTLKNMYYDIGDYKQIRLNVTEPHSEEFYQVLDAFANNSNYQGYYAQNDTNIERLKGLFSTASHYSINIPNTNVAVYKQNNFVYSNNTKRGILLNDESLNATNYKLFVISESNKYLNDETNAKYSSSYVSVKITRDSAMGTVRYSNDNMEYSNYENVGTELNTGSNSSPLASAEATSDKYVVFTWNIGSGATEVGLVTVSYYAPSNDYNSAIGAFYSSSATPKTIYEKGSDELAKYGEIGFVKINLVNGSTAEGLYKITRTYVGAVDAGSGDIQTRDYWFIVDRKNIMDNGTTGDKISINLLNGETAFNDFKKSTSETTSFEVRDRQIINTIAASVYLKTNKVPAVLNIPAYKFISGENMSKYLAGQLGYKVYYFDKYKQIDGNGAPYKVYEEKFGVNIIDGYFKIDFSGFVNSYATRFISIDNNNKGYIYLPGVYVIEIFDNVQGSTAHFKRIGFEINSELPSVDLIAVNNKTENLDNRTTDMPNDNKLTTNADFITFVLPSYDKDSTVAGTDTGYAEITSIDSQGNKSNIYVLTEGESGYVSQAGGNIGINLDSRVYLSLQDGNTYTIKFRYKLYNNNLFYKDYYYKWVNEAREDTYEVVYTIISDKTAPYENIKALMSVENAYINKFVDDDKSLFTENQEIVTGDKKSYVTDLTDKTKIYSFNVFADTKFIKGDTRYVYVYELSNELTSVATLSGDTKSIENVSNFCDLLSSAGYYEIKEIDLAGNITRYVVYYAGSVFENSLTLTLRLKTTSGGTAESENLTSEIPYLIFGIESSGHALSVEDGSAVFEIEGISDAKFVGYPNINLDNVAQAIASALSVAGRGNYVIHVYYRDTNLIVEENYTINYYGENGPTLDAKQLENSGYIELAAANIYDEENILYYATEISITKTIGNNSEKYFYKAELETVSGRRVAKYYRYVEDQKQTQAVSILSTESGASYLITIVDVYGRLSSHMFTTSDSIKLYEVDFAKNYVYDEQTQTYYTFGDAIINYDSGLFTCTIGGIEIGTETTLKANINNRDYYTIVFTTVDGSNISIEYKVVIDTRTRVPEIKDSDSVSADGIKVDINTNIDDTTPPDAVNLGTYRLTLTTADTDTEHFDYEYILYRVDGSTDNAKYFELSKLESGTFTINTLLENNGLYKLVVRVYSNDNDHVELGNKIYSFIIKAEVNKLYFVQIDGVEVEANAYFKKEDLKNISAEDCGVPDNYEMPLYVYNGEMIVVRNLKLLKDASQIDELYNDGKFKIYKVNATAYCLYFATLKVGENDSVVSDVKVGNGSIQSNENFSIVKYAKEDVKISFDRSGVSGVDLKNSVIVDIYYEDGSEPFKTLRLDDKDPSFTLRGSGKFKIKVRDLAGNKHVFRNVYNGEYSELKLTIIRDIPLMMSNGEEDDYFAAFDNGYFNGDIKLWVTSNEILKVGSIALSAERNGQAYTPEQNGFAYTFKGYGTYRVNVSAIYINIDSDGNTVEEDITKYIVFTIVNPDEAKRSIDLTNIKNYGIKEILTQEGADITSVVEQIISTNSNNRGLITYENLIDTKYNLNLVAGKQTFTLTYEVNDGIYPLREVTFAFTLNNEIPNIESSLAPGETSTKGFSITFNPFVIYQQVGESAIYVNDKLILEINAESANEVKVISFSQKTDGAGDYYITLKSSSGNVIVTMKSTIKEPLNPFAIIIIVVVVAIVLTVTITIIVLRRKMRIR